MVLSGTDSSHGGRLGLCLVLGVCLPLMGCTAGGGDRAGAGAGIGVKDSKPSRESTAPSIASTALVALGLNETSDEGGYWSAPAWLLRPAACRLAPKTCDAAGAGRRPREEGETMPVGGAEGTPPADPPQSPVQADLSPRRAPNDRPGCALPPRPRCARDAPWDPRPMTWLIYSSFWCDVIQEGTSARPRPRRGTPAALD